jgi:pimeloyl-ACP methyl ester carboxylesterase
MIEPRDGFVRANGVRLHYLEWGDLGRPVLLLLHGGSAHAHWWDFFSQELCDRYRLVALDLRGHGDSERPFSANYSLQALAADVSAFAEALGLGRLSLCGHSLGALVALQFGGCGAELGALVVIDSRLGIGRRSARLLDALGRFPEPVYADAEDAVRRFRLLPAATSAPSHVLERMARFGVRRREDGSWVLKFDRRSLVDTRPCDLSAVAAQIRCPVLVVRGARSEIVSAAALADFRRCAAPVSFLEIPDAHHHVMLDQPVALARAVGDFLSSVLADGGA